MFGADIWSRGESRLWIISDGYVFDCNTASPLIICSRQFPMILLLMSRCRLLMGRLHATSSFGGDVSRNCGSTANCGPELCCVD